MQVRHEQDEGQYVIESDGEVVGVLGYRLEGDIHYLMHTNVDPAFGGRGVGTQLVRDALADIRARGGRIVPVCSFIPRYLRDHPQDQDLLAD